MVKVYAAVKGAEIRVGNYGVATDARPVFVPAEVAKELTKLPDFRGDSEAQASSSVPPATETKPASGKKE